MRLRNKRLIAAVLSVVCGLTVIPFIPPVRAEEGMFTLDQIATLPLVKKGLKIKPADIYNPAGGGLSEAIPRLSIGCSSEFVSPEGLILTNHHCAIDGLVAASTVQNNYAEIGYKASNRSEELPAKNYSIDITLKEEDVTAQVLQGINAADAKAVAERITSLEKDEQTKMGSTVRVQIQSLNNGLLYYKFVYQTIKDIRIVYAPPYSIGQFGGDPDNFEWTRHGGDFTFMRAYVAPDGKATAYAKENVPYKPKKFLTVSTAGLKENDFTMIIGYPGGTTRYRESFSVDYNQNVQLPFTVDFLRARAEALELVGRGNPAKKVALQSEVFQLYNSLKAEEGGVAALKRGNVVRRKQQEEANLQTWIAKDATRTIYGAALGALQAVYADYRKTAPADVVLRAMPQIDQIGLLFAALSGQAPKERLLAAVPEVIKGEPVANREIFKFLLRKAAELPAGQRIAAIEKRFGNLSGEARLKAEDEFAAKAFEGESLTTEKGLSDLISLSPEQMRTSNDPLLSLVVELSPEIAAAFQRQQQLGTVISQNRPVFMAGMFALNGTKPYPDANFTQRFTYGAVKGYMPRESITYAPFTTLEGVFEKDTGREPFNSPAKLRSLWERKDYGSFGVGGVMPVDFLTSTDIIGGNSGSPVMNGRGELVGIAFDSNYEGLGDDFFFNPNLGRTISVDIRYVLFITEKFGEAGWILQEMTIKGNAKSATK